MINFPKNPTPGQAHQANGVVYVWDGRVWVGAASSPYAKDAFSE
jgi:hypothetical protein